jgi:hypothetical protein
MHVSLLLMLIGLVHVKQNNSDHVIRAGGWTKCRQQRSWSMFLLRAVRSESGACPAESSCKSSNKLSCLCVCVKAHVLFLHPCSKKSFPGPEKDFSGPRLDSVESQRMVNDAILPLSLSNSSHSCSDLFTLQHRKSQRCIEDKR